MSDFDFFLPGLGRPRSNRPQRVAEAIQHELALLLTGKVRDPRLAMVAISRVVTSPDLRLAKVYYHLGPGAGPRKQVQKAMERARGFFRSHIARTLNLRYTPELRFFYDDLYDEARRVEDLLTELQAEEDGQSTEAL